LDYASSRFPVSSLIPPLAYVPMQRTLLAILVVLAVLASPSAAQLQTSDLRLRVSAVAPVPINPTEFSDSYQIGRGVESMLGVFITPVFDLQLGLQYTVHLFSPSGDTVGTPLRPDLSYTDRDPSTSLPASPSALSDGTLSQLQIHLGLKYTFAESNDFDTYFRATGFAARVQRRQFDVRGNAVVDEFSRLALAEVSSLASGFDLGLGFEIPLSLTTSLILEPSYAVTYPSSDLATTLQIFNVRVGFLLNGN